MGTPEKPSGKHRRPSGYKRLIKRQTVRSNRKKARVDPETPPTYRKHRGYED